MSSRVKRTYNLSAQTIHHVRELADEYGVSPTQDGVVDTAIERLYASARAESESVRWAAAAEDPDFRTAMAEIAEAIRTP